jgi:serine/threonine protein kinase
MFIIVVLFVPVTGNRERSVCSITFLLPRIRSLSEPVSCINSKEVQLQTVKAKTVKTIHNLSMVSRMTKKATTMSMDGESSHRSRGSSSRSSSSRKPLRMAPSTPASETSPNCSKDFDSTLKAGNAAVERAMSLQKTTNLPLQADLMELRWEEVFVEDLLGVGGFASVCLVTCPKLRRKHGGSGKVSSDGHSSILSFDPSWGPSESCSMSVDEESEDISDGYALKCLSNRTMSNPRHFVTGASDLVGEAFLLSRLSHPNIIQLHGVTAGNIAEAFTKKGGYFLVLEALDNTLSSQLQVWRKDQVSSMDDFFNRAQGRSAAPSIEERLSIAMGIAQGMEYLHSNNVLFRDLKPDNVGFDRDGRVKLFDFGLARETSYEFLPGMAGSMLYLSPETMLEKYNCKASDVYSFGILTWELVSLLRPYPEFHKPDQLKKAVAVDGHRPDPRVVTHPVKSMIEACWQFNHAARPTFTQVLRYLEELRDNCKPRKVKSAPSRRSPVPL